MRGRCCRVPTCSLLRGHRCVANYQYLPRVIPHLSWSSSDSSFKHLHETPTPLLRISQPYSVRQHEDEGSKKNTRWTSAHIKCHVSFCSNMMENLWQSGLAASCYHITSHSISHCTHDGFKTQSWIVCYIQSTTLFCTLFVMSQQTSAVSSKLNPGGARFTDVKKPCAPSCQLKQINKNEIQNWPQNWLNIESQIVFFSIASFKNEKTKPINTRKNLPLRKEKSSLISKNGWKHGWDILPMSTLLIKISKKVRGTCE